MDTSFKKWVSLTPTRTLECSGQYIFDSFEPWRKDPLRFIIEKLPIMPHCPVVCSSRTEETLPALPLHCIFKINNEPFSACYDNGGFITVKPQRGTQLACAGHAGRLSPTSPANYSLLQHTNARRRLAARPRLHPAVDWTTFNLIKMQSRCCRRVRMRDGFPLDLPLADAAFLRPRGAPSMAMFGL